MSFKIQTIDFLSESAPRNLVRSLKETGFAVIKNHPIDDELLESVYKEWNNFFSSREKFRYPFDRDKQDGYFPFKSENAKGYHAKDLKEFYHIYPWGRYPSSIGESTLIFYENIQCLGEEFLDWIDQEVPAQVSKKFSVPLTEMVEDTDQNLLRVINYPPIKNLNTHGAIRAQEHADLNLITLLVSATQPGRQVKNLSGKWININSKPGELIINTGDMLQKCSGGYFPSTIHRVINPSKENKNKATF